MSRGKIELLGIDELLRDIREKLGGAADRVESKGLRAAGQPIADAMRRNVNRSNRKDAVHMADDIRVSNVRRKDGIKYVLIGGTKRTNWRHHFLEFGTSKMRPKPFAQPGFEEGKGDALQILVAEFRKGLNT